MALKRFSRNEEAPVKTSTVNVGKGVKYTCPKCGGKKIIEGNYNPNRMVFCLLDQNGMVAEV